MSRTTLYPPNTPSEPNTPDEPLTFEHPYSNQTQLTEFHTSFRNALTQIRSIEDMMIIRYNIVDKLFQKNSELVKDKTQQEIKEMLQTIADFIEMRDLRP